MVGLVLSVWYQAKVHGQKVNRMHPVEVLKDVGRYNAQTEAEKLIEFVQKKYPLDTLHFNPTQVEDLVKTLSPSNKGFDALLGLEKVLKLKAVQPLHVQLSAPFYLKQSYLMMHVVLVGDQFIISESGNGDELKGAAIHSINRKPVKEWIGQYLSAKSGAEYTRAAYHEALESIGYWIGGVLKSDSVSLLATDFYTKQVFRRTILPATYEQYTAWKQGCCASALSSSMLEEAVEEILYLNPAYEPLDLIRSKLRSVQSAPVILDLRQTNELSIDSMLFLAAELIPHKRPNFYLESGKGHEAVYYSSEAQEVEAELVEKQAIPKVLVGPQTGAVASVLASFLYDEQPDCLVGTPLSVPYEGGFLPDRALVSLCNESIAVRVPIARLRYMGTVFPLRDRGLLPETILIQTWEDYMLGEDTQLNALVEQLLKR